MPSFQYDLRYLQSGSEILEDYLLAQDVYWPVSIKAPAGETPYPQLTLGGLLLAQARAAGKAQTSEEKTQLTRVVEQITAIHNKWRTAWDNKAALEMRGRLTQWRNFIEDYRENSEVNYNRYPYEVFRRVIIQLFVGESASLSNAEAEMLAGLDEILKAKLVWGDFIWEAELETAFPQEAYWYLYGKLPKDGLNS